MHAFAFGLAALLLACIGVAALRDALVARASKRQGTEASAMYFVSGSGAAPSAVLSAGSEFNVIQDIKFGAALAVATLAFAGAGVAAAAAVHV